MTEGSPFSGRAGRSFFARGLLQVVTILLLSPVSLFAQIDSEQAELDQAEAAARLALDGFFEAFSRGDNDALQDFYSYPHVFVGSEGSIRVIEDRFDTDFNGLREREGWARSGLDQARAFLVKPDKVHFEIVFSRYRENGERYRTVSGLWIMTRQQGEWGLSLRSY